MSSVNIDFHIIYKCNLDMPPRIEYSTETENKSNAICISLAHPQNEEEFYFRYGVLVQKC